MSITCKWNDGSCYRVQGPYAWSSEGKLVREVTEVEIQHTIFSLGSDKSADPDGFTAKFFKVSRLIVKKICMCSNFLIFSPGKFL